MNSTQNGDTLSREGPYTLRAEVNMRLEQLREDVVRLTKIEHTLPARWYDMTREQIFEKTGVWVHI